MSIDLDSFFAGPLVNDWIKYLQKMKNEDIQSIEYATGLIFQFKAIREPSIEAAFKIASHLQVTPHTRYMAILLYDEFMYKYFQKMYTTEITNGLQEEQLDKICDKISSEAKLYLLSCFQLACKMDSLIRIEILEIINLLRVIDDKTMYTYDMVISSEYEVFKTVGFKIPLNTPLTCIEILLAITNRKEKMTYEIAILLLDVAFLQHEELYTRFYQETSESVESLIFKEPTLLKSDMLFLSAAIVACSMLFCNSDKLEPIVKILAEKSLSKETDIMTMANILFDLATQAR